MDSRWQNPPSNQFHPATQFKPTSEQYSTEYTTTQQYSTQYTTTSQQTNAINPNEGFFRRSQRNKPQSNSVGSASLIFMSGGINIAWSFQLISFSQVPTDLHIRICWFIGVIIGAFIGALLNDRCAKKPLVIFSAGLVTLGGILFISAPSNYDALVAARYIDGLATGIIFAPIMIMIAEEGNNYLRGMIASSTESLGFSTGIFVQLVYNSVWTQYIDISFTTAQMHGLLSIIFGLVAMLMAFLLMIESPVFHLMRNEEQQAIESLRHLQRPHTVTAETYAQLEEHKRYISEQNQITFMEGVIIGLPALLKLCLYRGMIALTFSFVTSVAFAISSVVTTGTIYWTFFLYGILRWFGAFAGVFTIDSRGRKKPMFLAILICGGMSIGLGVIFAETMNITAATYLLFIQQFFAGLFATTSSAYLCEAFPMVVKPYYIAIAVSVEMLVHIIILATTTLNFSGYFYTVGVLSFVFTAFGIWCLPETRYMTLRDAEAKFRELFGRASF